MKHPFAIPKLLILALSTLLMQTVPAHSAESLPPDSSIGPPQGRIAFIRDGNIWAMEANGENQMIVCEVTNANGRLSWSPDGKRIAFTRQGQVNVQGPDMGGGVHRLYDLFLANMDSAYVNKPEFWFPLTGDMGNRYPEWSRDPKTILFYKDVNANNVNAGEPNYQLAILTYDENTTQPRGAQVKLLRDDWEDAQEYLTSPSMNANGDLACVCMFQQKPQGMVVLRKDEYRLPMDSVKARSLKNPNCVAPAWSPDGQWIAYVNNNMNDGRLYIATPDLQTKYVVFTPPSPTALYTVAPSFSPDSKWLTFSTNDGSIWISRITGEGAERLTGPGTDKFPAWSQNP